MIHEPNSVIYKDLDQWAIRGYITESLPLIRPYPAQLLDVLLEQVIRRGNPEAVKKAEAYQKEIAVGSRLIHPAISAAVEGKNGEAEFIGAPSADGVLRLSNWLTASYYLAFYGITNDDGANYNVPGTYTPYHDFIPDVANVGKIEIRQEWTSILAVGKSNFYFQAGLARTSFGPFYDNGTVIGPQAPRAGHFSLNYRRSLWSFEMLFQTLTATDDFGKNKESEKFLILHSFNFRPLSNLEFGLIESVVWGGRFDPLYLVPFDYLFAAQSMGGFYDNSFIGLHIRWNPMPNWETKAQVYIDDFPFNDIFNGNQKYKLAGELGVVWAPPRGLFSSVSFDYTAVFPYMYTHWNIPDVNRYEPEKSNYWNYTHLGKNLGAELEPNSDRFSLRSSWRTLPDIDVSVSAYFIRHGNASTGKALLTDMARHDGSIFDDGATDEVNADGDPDSSKNPYIYLNFLTQDIIDTRLGGGFGVTWSLPTSIGVFQLTGEYALEYGWNRGLVKGNNKLDHYWSIGGIWRW
jgi:hypothetical protein